MLNRNILLPVITIVAIVLFAGCSKGQLTEENMLSIKYGMTIKEVEGEIGKPKEILTDSEKIREIDKEFSEKSGDRLVWEDPDLYIIFSGGSEELKKIDKQMKTSNNLTAYQYPYKNSLKENAIWTIYFNKDKVIWMSFP